MGTVGAMNRSTKGLGSITRLSSGKWRVKVPVGRYPNGVTRYKSKDCDSKTEARNVQRQLVALREQNQLVAGPQVSFRTYATEVLMNPSDRVRARTLDGYFRNLSTHVFPVLGHKALTDIRSREIESLLCELRKRRSASTVNNVRIAMSKVFTIAERHELVLSNPVRRTEKARRGELEPTQVQVPWSIEEAQHALACAVGTPLESFFSLILSTGMRRGEALALTWDDIDFETSTVSIDKTIRRESLIQRDGSRVTQVAVVPPKTAQSRRVNHLTMPVLDALRRHKIEQELDWISRGSHETAPIHVFTNAHGGPLDESKLSSRYRKFCRENNIRQIRIHDMRHTFATVLIDDDPRNIAAVSKALGHSSLAITLDIYGKTSSVESKAITRMGEILFPDRVGEVGQSCATTDLIAPSLHAKWKVG